MIRTSFLPTVLLALWLTGCCDSLPPAQEAAVRFSAGSSAPRFRQVYPWGSDSTHSRAILRGPDGVGLPLNLNADSTTYVFKNTAGRLDTLTFRYRRELALNSGCNPQYYQRVVEADLPRERQVETTLGQVVRVAFGVNAFPEYSEIVIEIQP